MSRATSVLVAALIVLASFAPAGAARAAPLAVTFEAGLSAATLRGDLPTDPFVANRTRMGWAGGVAATLATGGAFAIQPELLYVMKGTSLGEITVTDSGGATLGTAKDFLAFDYVELPVLARYAVPAGGGFATYLIGGPALAIRLSQKHRTTGALESSADLNFVKSTEVGLVAGAGAEFGRGRVRGALQARYTLGLTSATESWYSDNARNAAFLVLAGLALHP